MNRERRLSRQRLRRKRHTRKTLRGTPDRPRLTVFRSQRHIYCQIVDDLSGQTLAAASTIEPELAKQTGGRADKEAAKTVGVTLAQRAVAAGLSQVRFDRGSYKYHGRIAALADGAREGGLGF